MSSNIFVRIMVFLLFSSCSTNTTDKCDVCLDTRFKINNDVFLLEMVFSSKVDTSLIIPGETLIVGCPFYQEEQVYFKKSKPNINELKYTQIILENERGNFRVYSSQFVNPKEETIMLMPNCAFVDEKVLNLNKGQEETFVLHVLSSTDLKVDKADKKVRIHIYYKDEVDKIGVVISSSNWIRIK